MGKMPARVAKFLKKRIFWDFFGKTLGFSERKKFPENFQSFSIQMVELTTFKLDEFFRAQDS